MDSFLKWGTTFCLISALTSMPALAQQGPGREIADLYPDESGICLLANQGVREELNVSEDQASKMNALAEKQMSKAREVLSKLADLSPEERRTKVLEHHRGIAPEVRKSLAPILRPQQLNRFNQIVTQGLWISAFSTPDVQKTLKLTDEQKTKICDIERAFQELLNREFQAAQKASPQDQLALLKKLMELGKPIEEKIIALLTDDQRAIWKNLTGEPYKFKF